MTRLSACNDYCIVKLDKYINQTKNGLFISPLSETTPVTGTIISCGPRVKNELLKENQRVMLDRYAGIILENRERDEKLCIVKESNINSLVDDDFYYDFSINKNLAECAASRLQSVSSD